MPPWAQLRCSAAFKPECVSRCDACSLGAANACQRCLAPSLRAAEQLQPQQRPPLPPKLPVALAARPPQQQPPLPPQESEAACNTSTRGGRTPIRWLHIPKCGSTFSITALQYACFGHLPTWYMVYMTLAGGQVEVRVGRALNASRYAKAGSRCNGQLLLPFGTHAPVSGAQLRGGTGSKPRVYASPTGGGIAVMLRQPAQRLISAFLDNYHAPGMIWHTDRGRMKKEAPTVDLWARFPGVAGCATKLLAGRECAALLRPGEDRAILTKAIDLLRSPAVVFVGVVEAWDASICLFHRMMGGGSSPLAAEFDFVGHSHNSRQASKLVDGCRLVDRHGVCYASTVPGRYNASVLGGFVDVLDDRLYAEAVRIFQRNLRLFDLTGMLRGDQMHALSVHEQLVRHSNKATGHRA